ncbi:restriction endonuclease [Streptomyces griseoluteus]|uniref:restriction endonuclease n=1 Tax=Streptomyces griseoluteus TaxID=29306 RepID=UPI0036BCE084
MDEDQPQADYLEERYSSELLQEFHGLRSSSNAHQRGHKLEELLERAFRKAHYRVVHNARIAKPRQTDFAVTSRSDRYLVEAKWEKDPIDVSVVGGIRDRMSRTDASVVGVLMTVSDINTEAAQDIVVRRDRGLVLVFNEPDILKVLKDPHELERLLRQKHDELVIHGRLDRGIRSGDKEVRRLGRRKELPGSHFKLIDTVHKPISWFGGLGDFSSTVFALGLPDIDWVSGSGSGVSLDMPVAAWNQIELIDLLHELSDTGWMTSQAHWSIKQHGWNWHGTGPKAFVQALKDWKRRTEGLRDPHHSEEFAYLDTCDGGFYTISGSLSAGSERQLLRCNVSFQLTGIPLDPSPLQHLYARFEAPRRGHFRPLVERSVTRGRLHRRVPLDVVGYITEPEKYGRSNQDWVVGIAVTNPFINDATDAPEYWPSQLRESGVLVCDLRSHHPLNEANKSYELVSFEHAWTSDAQALRLCADW